MFQVILTDVIRFDVTKCFADRISLRVRNTKITLYFVKAFFKILVVYIISKRLNHCKESNQKDETDSEVERKHKENEMETNEMDCLKVGREMTSKDGE